MRTVTDAVPSLIAYWDSDLCCRFANQVFLDWIGKTSAEAMGMRFQALLGESVFQLNRSFIEGVLAGIPQEFEREVPRFDGIVRATLESYIPDIGPSGDVLGFYVVVADVTRVKEGDAAVRLNASVFSATSEGIMVTDAAGALVAVNPAFCAITGYEEHAVLGHNPRFLQSGKHSAEFYAELWQSLLDNESWAGELWCKRKNGELYLEALSISSIKDAHGKAVRYVGVFSDVTARHAHDEQIRHLALHDALTNLPNRRLMSERLTQLLELSTREPRKLAVIFLDLDGFKSINDQHGHDVGDFVLKTVAVRLHELFRTVDTVARFGGDEFVVLIHNAEGTESLVQIAQRIVATVNLPIRVGTICAQVGTSVGIAVHPQNGSSVVELLTHADAAMYEAKRSGKNTFRFTPAPV
jgi:diguanylate cyclase (GGDEF)-like protein/PAS domain S-box-containing protein